MSADQSRVVPDCDVPMSVSVTNLDDLVRHMSAMISMAPAVARTLPDVDSMERLRLTHEAATWKHAIKNVFDLGQHSDPRATIAAADAALNAALKPYADLLHAEDTMQMLDLKYKQQGRESAEVVRRANFRHGITNVVGAHVTSLPNVLPGVGGRMVPVQDFDHQYN